MKHVSDDDTVIIGHKKWYRRHVSIRWYRRHSGEQIRRTNTDKSLLDPSRILGRLRGLKPNFFGSIRGSLQKKKTACIQIWASPLRGENRLRRDVFF